jgi:hypothetical protein
VIENNAYPWDLRMYNEAQALKKAGYEVNVICPKGEQSDVSECLLSRLEE